MSDQGLHLYMTVTYPVEYAVYLQYLVHVFAEVQNVSSNETAHYTCWVT